MVQKSRFGSGWEGAAWNHCSSVWQDEATKKKCGLCKSNTGLEGRSKGPYLKTRTPGKVNCPGVPDSSERHLVDVVLLPMEGGVGLDDDVFVRVLFEFVDEHGLARLQSFGDFGIHADGEVRAFVIGGGHLACFGLDFVAERRNGLDHARASAVRARLAEHALKSLFGALARDADETKFVEGKRL